MVTDNRCKAKKDQLHSDMNNLFRIIHYKLGLITEFDGKIRQFFPPNLLYEYNSKADFT